MSRLQNEAARQHICNNFNSENQLEDMDNNMIDQDESNSNDFNINTTNTQVENFIAESVEKFCPPFAASVKKTVSKFKFHVDQYSNMQNLAKERVEISREHKLVNKEWLS